MSLLVIIGGVLSLVAVIPDLKVCGLPESNVLVHLSLLIKSLSQEFELIFAENMAEDSIMLRNFHITISQIREVRKCHLKSWLVATKPVIFGFRGVLNQIIVLPGSLECHIDQCTKATDVPVVQLGFLAVHMNLC